MTVRFRSHVALSAEARATLVDALNGTLAATLDLGSQLKQAHWNVRGEGFRASHLMFDELYGRVVGWTDQVAERVAQLGGHVDGTVRNAAARSPLAEHDATAVLALDHIRSLTNQYALLCTILRRRIDGQESVLEPVTSDLFTEVLRGLESDLWMLESHLEQGLARPAEAARQKSPLEEKADIIRG